MKSLKLITAFILLSCSLFGQTETTKGDAKTKPTGSNQEELVLNPEKRPLFPGGDMEMIMFLQKNVHTPEDAKKNKITGASYVNFIVEKDGSLTNIKVRQGAENIAALDAEALRVVKMMPKWTPGTQGGVVVRTQYSLPITFR